MRLIDAEEVANCYERMMKNLDEKNALPEQITEFAVAREYLQWASYVINNTPTVDAVDKELYEQCKFDKDIAEEQLKNIVRCKDCKHSSPNGKYGCNLITDDGSREMGLLGDDYCSYGERRGEEWREG